MPRTELVTVLIHPDDEAAVLHAVQDALGEGGLHFADDTNPALLDQWAVEHPDTPVGPRRVRTVSAEVEEASASRVAEVFIDVICPHARAEDEQLRAREPFTATADEIPWSALTPLWDRTWPEE